MTVLIRPLCARDGTQAAQIFFDAVHIGTADVYSEQERIAWAGDKPDIQRWRTRFENLEGVAAEQAGALLGFMTLDASGAIELAFVAPRVMGQGIGRQLYEAIEGRAVATGLCRLQTEASKKAKPFFARMGWQVDSMQHIPRGDVVLINFKMHKDLRLV